VTGWLLPQERWFAGVSERNGPAPAGWPERLPAGGAVLRCGVFWLSAGGPTAIAGTVTAIGGLLYVPMAVRFARCSALGRAYRDGRPFLRSRSARG
jgi:hypothetical protein